MTLFKKCLPYIVTVALGAGCSNDPRTNTSFDTASKNWSLVDDNGPVVNGAKANGAKANHHGREQ